MITLSTQGTPVCTSTEPVSTAGAETHVPTGENNRVSSIRQARNALLRGRARGARALCRSQRGVRLAVDLQHFQPLALSALQTSARRSAYQNMLPEHTDRAVSLHLQLGQLLVAARGGQGRLAFENINGFGHCERSLPFRGCLDRHFLDQRAAMAGPELDRSRRRHIHSALQQDAQVVRSLCSKRSAWNVCRQVNHCHLPADVPAERCRRQGDLSGERIWCPQIAAQAARSSLSIAACICDVAASVGTEDASKLPSTLHCKRL